MAGYTVAVLADMHGNDAAFAAALADLATVPHDAIVLAGDLLVNGPRPRAVLARARGLGAPAVCGNTDRYLVEDRADPVVTGVVDMAYHAGETAAVLLEPELGGRRS